MAAPAAKSGRPARAACASFPTSLLYNLRKVGTGSPSADLSLPTSLAEHGGYFWIGQQIVFKRFTRIICKHEPQRGSTPQPRVHFSVPWDLENQNRPYPERVLQKRMEYPKTLLRWSVTACTTLTGLFLLTFHLYPGFRLRSTQGCVVGRFQRQLLRLPRPCPAKNVAHGQSAVGGGANKMFPRLQSASKLSSL